MVILVAALAIATSAFAQTQVKYVKYQAGTPHRVGHPRERDDHPRDLRGAVGTAPSRPAARVKLAEVKLMAPAEAKKVIAAGLNYKSHIGQASPAKYVGLFAKFPTSLSGHEAEIPYPADATTVHYEAEICVVIGKKAQNITEAQVKDHIFGVTACNDVSERAWQKQDLQWFRAKAHDGWGPMGPHLVSNVDYNNLKLIGRHNGKVVQETTTDLLIFSINNVVSLYEPLHHARARRCDLHRHAGRDAGDEARRHVRSGSGRRHHAAQQGRRAEGRRHLLTAIAHASRARRCRRPLHHEPDGATAGRR